MNERIKELALEAFQPINDITTEGVADRHTFEQAWFQHYNQKFAELIGKECGIALSPMLRDMVSRGQAFDLIKKHFGVEE